MTIETTVVPTSGITIWAVFHMPATSVPDRPIRSWSSRAASARSPLVSGSSTDRGRSSGWSVTSPSPTERVGAGDDGGEPGHLGVEVVVLPT